MIKQLVTELTEEIVAAMTDAELQSNITSLTTQQTNMANTYATTQIIISNDAEAVMGILQNVEFAVLPQLEYKIELATAVALTHEFVVNAVLNRCITITPVQFKNLVRAIATTPFKGSEVAIILDQLSSLLDNVAKEVSKLDKSYNTIAQNLDLLYQEVDKRAITINTNDTTEAVCTCCGETEETCNCLESSFAATDEVGSDETQG